MLELRPSCEHCQKLLSPDSSEAMICTYECTFCRDCVENILENICPNCGGNFVERPIRPKKEWIKGTSLINQPASQKHIYKPVNISVFKNLKDKLRNTAPEKR